jgi:hypothetical protein
VDSDDAHDRSAGAPPAVAGATRPRFGEVVIRDRGCLPHWEQDNATYFVTFRLTDSLPKSALIASNQSVRAFSFSQNSNPDRSHRAKTCT